MFEDDGAEVMVEGGMEDAEEEERIPWTPQDFMADSAFASLVHDTFCWEGKKKGY